LQQDLILNESFDVATYLALANDVEVFRSKRHTRIKIENCFKQLWCSWCWISWNDNYDV